MDEKCYVVKVFYNLLRSSEVAGTGKVPEQSGKGIERIIVVLSDCDI